MTRLKALVLAMLATITLSSCEFSVYDLPLPGGADVGDDPMQVTVEFTDVLDLVPQSTVKVNDVSVGMVRDVRLDGYTAEVVLEVRDSVDLPANAVARIRQTSLLGEKFVELAAPEQGASTEPLESGARIPLDRSGRNPEVEEVFGALSLVLNGGGVAQLRTISVELNKALEGREDSVRSVLRQIDSFTGQLDGRKTEIVRAIESLDALARGIQEEQGTIDAALDELPSAIKSINSQRRDLVRMLQALNDLSGVGVRVIRATKDNTIASLRALDPVLTQLANAGDDFAKAFQVFLTYPFVDEVVGRDPQVARNLHMGDYTNLAIKMDLDLAELIENPPGIPDECVRLEQVRENIPLEQIRQIEDLCRGAITTINSCLKKKTLRACADIPRGVIRDICKVAGIRNVCRPPGPGGGSPLPPLQIPQLPIGSGSSSEGGGLLGGLSRAPFGPDPGRGSAPPAAGEGLADYDPDLVRLLVPGMVTR